MRKDYDLVMRVAVRSRDGQHILIIDDSHAPESGLVSSCKSPLAEASCIRSFDYSNNIKV